MASPFYARYVPGSAASPGAVTVKKNDAALPQKRKREDDDDVPDSSPAKTAKSENKSKKKKKSGHASLQDGTPEGEKQPQSDTVGQDRSDESVQADRRAKREKKKKKQKKTTTTTSEVEIPTEHGEAGVDKSLETDEGAEDNVREQQGVTTDGVDGASGTQGEEEPQQQTEKKKKKRRKIENNIIDPGNRESTKKHAKIISKFEQSRLNAQKLSKTKDEEAGESSEKQVESHGLEPLPQPAPAPESKELPTYSTLPSWLAEPYYVSPDLRRDFATLAIDRRLVSALESKGFTQAFPVQSAVMDLVSEGAANYHEGDICISAATGSGKTLAYAIPLVQGIQYSPVHRLRGLIVVPTRELVKQARDACELCASGTGLRIGTAVGSTALKEEQQQIMGHDQVYDPVAYRERNEKPMGPEDWARFSLAEYLADAEEFQASLPDHVPTASPNVDILICTPGRLVDHVRSTKGFTLEHVEWLVIDEADRLLNESFQEWVETVMPAFDARRDAESTGSAQSFLGRLGMSMSRPKLRKIVLSATMTRDITKLNSLRLQHPKLVVMEAKAAKAEERQDAETAAATAANDRYRLPARLSEFYVPVGDGSEKPLYLLQLLVSRLKIETRGGSPRPRSSSLSSEASSSSSDETSDSDSTSSASDSTSDSDSDSVSSVSSSSSDSSAASSSNSSEAADDGRRKPTALIFTKSSESAARLSRLLCLLHPPFSQVMGTLTKSNRSSSSRRTLSAYRQGRISIIVATDRASRGLDLPSLSHVISYDVPASLTSYIHRIGRTARAGREGCAWTLVAHREGRWFRNEIVRGALERIGGERVVKKVAVDWGEDEGLKARYADALAQLERQVVESTRRVNRSEKPRVS